MIGQYEDAARNQDEEGEPLYDLLFFRYRQQ